MFELSYTEVAKFCDGFFSGEENEFSVKWHTYLIILEYFFVSFSKSTHCEIKIGQIFLWYLTKIFQIFVIIGIPDRG